jgi:hypothetical protein
MRLLVALLTIALSAQVPRDTSARPPMPTGTAVLSGVVVADTAAHEPIGRAIVTATSAEVPAGRSAITDDRGQFAIANLPVGKFKITATKPAFLTTALGALRPGGSGAELVVSAGQHVDNLMLTMTHGAAMSGMVRDAMGQPMANVRVAAFRSRKDQTYVASLGTTATDERGRYRMFGLMAGDYIVVATASREIQLGSSVETLTTAEVDAIFAALERRQASGTSNATAAASAARDRASERPSTISLAPVFYPGTLDLSRAERVNVPAAADVSNIDINFTEGRAAEVEGIVIVQDRASQRLSLAMALDGPALPALASRPSLTLRPGADGRFRFGGVAPGRYIVLATARRTTDTTTPAGESTLSWARAEVDINGADLSGITLALQPAVTLHGRISMESGSAPAMPRNVRVTLQDVSPFAALVTMGLATPNPITATMKADGTFDLSDVVPGRYTLDVKADGWVPMNAVLGDRPAFDTPFEVRADAAELSIVLTNRSAEISGTLQAPAQFSPSSYFVVVFAGDPAQRVGSRVRVTRVDTAGKFTVANLLPGDYLVGVATDIDTTEAIEAQLFAALERAAVSATLELGEQKVLNLKVGG